MAPPADPPGHPAGMCRYGLQKFPPLLEALNREIPGVRAAEDIEYVHRMRVASRRLRAALPLFRPCFPEKQYILWMREITRITRALGEARDADVQIAFLRKMQKKLRKTDSAPAGEIAAEQVLGSALSFLLDDLQKRRKSLQESVITALSALEISGTISGMERILSVRIQEFRAEQKKIPPYGISFPAAVRIGKRIADLRSFEPWLQHPEAVAEHHAARIAAKKLRYTLEIYGDMYRNNLKKPISRVKRIQDLLGELHDCDVWIDHVNRILLKERSLLRKTGERKRPDPPTLSGLKVFLQEREAERRHLFRRFVRYCQFLSRTGFWEELAETLDKGRKKRFLFAGWPQNDIPAAVDLLAKESPGMLPHSRHVTFLALRFFDALVPLHQLGARDRFLLQCAALLHDIGWKEGQAGHNKRGAKMAFSHEPLPFDLAERCIISFAILSHRGSASYTSHPYFLTLSAENRKKALMIASLLRFSDGLDYLHTGSVQEIRCTLQEGSVVCDITGTGTLTAEKERALMKSDLFIRVFDRRLVIR